MKAADKARLVKAIGVTAELTGTVLSEAALERMVEILGAYRGDQIVAALGRCEMELRPGGFALSALLERLDDGWPGAEEAWAIVSGLTEADTVVWTDEIAAAWGVASEVLPDRVGARMAFLESYRRALAGIRSAGAPPRWWASVGDDPQGRVGPIQDAVARGRLSLRQAQAALPPERWPAEGRPAVPAPRLPLAALTRAGDDEKGAG